MPEGLRSNNGRDFKFSGNQPKRPELKIVPPADDDEGDVLTSDGKLSKDGSFSGGDDTTRYEATQREIAEENAAFDKTPLPPTEITAEAFADYQSGVTRDINKGIEGLINAKNRRAAVPETNKTPPAIPENLPVEDAYEQLNDSDIIDDDETGSRAKEEADAEKAFLEEQALRQEAERQEAREILAKRKEQKEQERQESIQKTRDALEAIIDEAIDPNEQIGSAQDLNPQYTIQKLQQDIYTKVQNFLSEYTPQGAERTKYTELQKRLKEAREKNDPQVYKQAVAQVEIYMDRIKNSQFNDKEEDFFKAPKTQQGREKIKNISDAGYLKPKSVLKTIGSYLGSFFRK